MELIFSRKRNELDHPVIHFNNIRLEKVNEHKHLGIILDPKLSFSAHIRTAISKSRKGIGLPKCLSKYLPRRTLNELYKLHVRPHLDYGDVIYHIPAKVCEFSGSITLPNLMEKLESVQYSSARAVTGTWRGTSREKLYAELGWESLSSRRWSRRLTVFYKVINNLTPIYMKDPIPQPPQSRRDTLFATRMPLGEPGQEQKSSNLAFILTAYLNGIKLILKLGLRHLLLFLRQSFYQ